MLDVRLAPADSGAAEMPLPEDPADVRTAAGKFARGLSARRSTVRADGVAGARLTALVEGLVLGAYRFTERQSPKRGPERIELAGADDEAALERGRRAAAATVWARDLTNTRSNTKTPAWLAEQAVREFAGTGVDVTIRDENWLREQRFGGILAVGNGSASPPRLIEAAYRPRGARGGSHVVLVGKGITFDTGGINRKPGDSMRTMYTDMAGGAAVLAAVRAAADERLPVRVTALVPTAENAFSGSAYRPSDVVRHYGGRTSEIHNTDAEGRLVLADAMAYAVARLKPTALVDIATLTGAMKVALGLRTGGVLATSDDLAGELLAAGDATGERLWRLPLLPEHEEQLRSDVADANNAPGNPGAITAALFLRPFAGSVPWAHLDIAGPARAGSDDGLLAKGATGFGARLLHRWLVGQA